MGMVNYFSFKEIVSSYKGFSIKTWVNILALLVNAMGNMATLFMALYLITKLNFSPSNASHIVATFSLGLVFGTYFGGYLCEYIHSFKLAVIALLIAGLSILLFPITKYYFSLLLLVFFMGSWYGIFKPANLITLLSDYSDKQQTKIMSLYRIAINLGNGLATAIGGILASIDYHWVFWFDGITSVIAASILFYFRKLYLNTIPLSAAKKITGKLKTIFKNKVFILCCLILFLSSLIFYQIQFGYPVYLHQYYYLSARELGYLFFINCILIVLLQVPILHILRNLNQLNIALTGMMLITLGFCMLPFGVSKPFAVLSFVIWTFGEMLLYPILFSVAMSSSTLEVRSRSIGIYQTVYTGASVVAPAIGGFLYPLNHGVVLWIFCGLCGVLSLLGFKLVKQYTRPV